MADKRWIDEQAEQFNLMGGQGMTNDPGRMLEYGGINKISDPDQSKKVITARLLGKRLGLKFVADTCDAVEMAQMYQNATSRQDFMKVAIEQWQGKLQALKSKTLSEIL